MKYLKFIFFLLYSFTLISQEVKKEDFNVTSRGAKTGIASSIIDVNFKITPFIPTYLQNQSEVYIVNLKYEEVGNIDDFNAQDDVDAFMEDTEYNFKKRINIIESLSGAILNPGGKSHNGRIEGNNILFEAGKECFFSLDLNEVFGFDASFDDFEFDIEIIPYTIPFHVKDVKIYDWGSIVKLKAKPGKTLNIPISGPTNNTSYTVKLLNESKEILEITEAVFDDSDDGYSFSVDLEIPSLPKKGDYFIQISKFNFGDQLLEFPIRAKKSSAIPYIGLAVIGGIVGVLTSGSVSGGKGNPPLPEPPLPGGN